jgi:superfamily II DNA or RNA helicase
MCKTQEEGGMRCATHTRPRYEGLIEAMDNGTKGMGKAERRSEARRQFAMDDENALNVAINHAATPTGHKQIEKDLVRFQSEGDQKTVAFLKNALRKGEERAEVAKVSTALIKKAKAKVVGHRGGGAGTGSVETLKPSRGTTLDNNCLAVHPDIAKYWVAEDNDGIGPDQVRPGSNGQLNYRCGECKAPVSKHNFRVNMMTSALKAGRIPVCDACDPRRLERFSATQRELGSLTDAIGDPEAFNALPPALQYSLMQKMGLLRGNQDSMNRSVAMSIVHGDLTLKDVVAANDFNSIDGKVREHGEEDDALTDISNVDLTQGSVDFDDSPTARAEQALACAGVLTLIDEESELAESIRRVTNETFWEQANNADDIDGFVEFLQSRRGRSAPADAATDRFVAELAAVRNAPLPEGYEAARVNAEGVEVSLEPTLAQRRFAALVAEKRRFTNWSGTGAGKTLSATLAVQGTGARETVVVCPKPVLDQWQAEFTNGFPENTEVRRGLPEAGVDYPPPPPGVNRVWVTNYDQFQGDAEALKERLNPLADRVDAIVYDEIHMAKASDAATTSRRRTALEDFTDRAGRANDNLVVIGASATPVVNNLEEAKSVLRLVEGPESKSFPTKPTMKNAALAYARISTAGVRNMPNYPSKLERNNIEVDISTSVHRVQARINDMRQKSKSNRVTPAMMERALLPEKLPAIVDRVKSNKSQNLGPTVVYTEYTAGMVSPMKAAFEKEGLRVRTYTGDESDEARANNLAAFNRGEIDVLIGSRPIATGIDGMQHSSSRMVVASMAWTAAQDDQLVGRLQRRGQTRDVGVDYVLTEATAGNLKWSWCKDNRMKRVHFKRDIANAAVDGVLPEGSFESNDQGAEKAVGALKDLAKVLSQTA